MPITIRIPSFGGLRGKEHHGESPETYYAHTAGLKVVVPSDAPDAYRLLRLSIADPDPVIFLEPKVLYGRATDRDGADLSVDGPGLGEAVLYRPEGADCTIVTYGAMRLRSLDAARVLAEEGIGVRVIDLRSLVPLDIATVLRCVSETGRAVVVHEGPRTLGMGAEIAARIVEGAFGELKGPVLRVTGYDVPYPPAALEARYLPSVGRICSAVRGLVGR